MSEVPISVILDGLSDNLTRLQTAGEVQALTPELFQTLTNRMRKLIGDARRATDLEEQFDLSNLNDRGRQLMMDGHKITRRAHVVVIDGDRA